MFVFASLFQKIVIVTITWTILININYARNAGYYDKHIIVPEFASVTDVGDWSKQNTILQRDPQIPVDVYLAGKSTLHHHIIKTMTDFPSWL